MASPGRSLFARCGWTPRSRRAVVPYRELVVTLSLNPPPGAGTRAFVLHYDVVLHQVVTHSALVSIRYDWATGAVGERPVSVGTIAVDTRTSRINPLEVSLVRGSLW